jgi:hypothetical protein
MYIIILAFHLIDFKKMVKILLNNLTRNTMTTKLFKVRQSFQFYIVSENILLCSVHLRNITIIMIKSQEIDNVKRN